MNTQGVLVIAMLLSYSSQALAWEEDAVLTFILRTNPLLQAHRNVTQAYTKPDAINWVIQNSALVARLTAGGTDFTKAPYTAYGGIQLTIPLSSVALDRELATKRVAEQKEVADLQSNLIQEITLLRTLEAEVEASQVRSQFLKEKAAWQKKRIEEGYSTELEQLWAIGNNLNVEDALVAKLNIQIKTQRYKIAKYAGREWKTLLGYLEGKIQTLGEDDG